MPGAPRFADRFMLPRWLRRPVRLVVRFVTWDFVPPRFAASIGTALLFGTTGIYGAYCGGEMPEVAQAVTARTGFAVDQVRVVGHRETSEIDVLEKLELSGWTSLIGFDADAALNRVRQLPWVADASVRKVYPETLEIKIDEREPFAVWQQGSDLSIIGAHGNIIVPYDGGKFRLLPLVVGYGAGPRAAQFIGQVAKYPELANRVRGYMLVAERRWDLRLDNGVTIKLPETDVDDAIAELLRVNREDGGLFNRDIVAIDMRFSDRMVVKLSPDAAAAREAALVESSKSNKSKPEKKRI